MRATAKDMRFHSKEILDAVSRGEEVVITFRGRPKVRIIPFKEREAPSAPAELGLFGMWKDNPAVADVNGYVSKIRKGRFD